MTKRKTLSWMVGIVALAILGCSGGGGGGGGGGGFKVDSISPDSGDVAGGTTVQIEGRGFGNDPGAITVEIGGQPVDNLAIFDKGKTITGNTRPAAGPGPADLVVTKGGKVETIAGGFTYFEPVTLSSISPTFGPVWGGTGVTVVGTGFVAGTSLTIGGNELQNLAVVSNTEIRGFTPPGAGGGTSDVAVTNQNGTDVISGGFEYFSPVIIFSLVPSAGPTAGGTSVTIRGTGFIPGTQVTLGGKPLVNLTVLNDAEITGVTPAGDTFGAVDVSASNTNGSFTFDNGFTYYDDVTVTSVDPQGGPVLGGIAITIRGTGFVSGSAASLGVNNVDNLVVVDDTLMTGNVPSTTGPGVVDVIVVTPFGTNSLVGGFEYFSSVSITGITPTSWMTKGGLPVTVTGTGLFPGTTMRLGGMELLNPHFVDTSTVVGAVPSSPAAGTVDVEVSNVNGSDTLAGAFTYVDFSVSSYDTGKNGRIQSIHDDGAGGLWLGFDNDWDFDQGGLALMYLDDGGTPGDPTDDQIQTWDGNDGLISSNIWRIVSDGGTGLWLATGSDWCRCGEVGVYYLDHNGTPLNKADDQMVLYDSATTGLPWDYVMSIVPDSTFGGIWMATYEAGLAYLDHNGTPLDPLDDTWLVRTTSDGMWDDRLGFAAPAGGNLVVIGYDTNIFQYMDHGGNPLSTVGDTYGSSLWLPSASGHTIIDEPSSPNMCWIGGYHWDLVLFDDGGTPMSSSGDSYTEFTTSDGLLTSGIKNLIVEGSGVWAATRDGLSRLDHQGTLTNKGDDVWTSFMESDGLSNQRLLAMERSGATSLWLGTETGLNHFEYAGTPSTKTDDTWTPYLFELPGEPRDIQPDPNGGVWIGTERVTAYVGDAGTPSNPLDDFWVYYTNADGLSHTWVSSVFPDPNGTGVWFVTDTVEYLDHNGTPANKADDTIYTLNPPIAPAIDQWDGSRTVASTFGGLWIMTEQNGALYFDHGGTPTDPSDDTWVTYSTPDGMPSGYVTDLSEDGNDGVWFTTTGGVLYLDTRGTILVKIDDLKAIYTATDSGLVDTVTACVLVDPSGDGVWFGTINGMSYLDHNGTPALKVDDDWTTYTTGDGMVSNFVWRMIPDGRGLVWFAYSTQFSTPDGVSLFNSSGTPTDKSDDFWGRVDSGDGLSMPDIDQQMIALTSGGFWVGGRDWPTSYFYFVAW